MYMSGTVQWSTYRRGYDHVCFFLESSLFCLNISTSNQQNWFKRLMFEQQLKLCVRLLCEFSVWSDDQHVRLHANGIYALVVKLFNNKCINIMKSINKPQKSRRTRTKQKTKKQKSESNCLFVYFQPQHTVSETRVFSLCLSWLDQEHRLLCTNKIK